MVDSYNNRIIEIQQSALFGALINIKNLLRSQSSFGCKQRLKIFFELEQENDRQNSSSVSSTTIILISAARVGQRTYIKSTSSRISTKHYWPGDNQKYLCPVQLCLHPPLEYLTDSIDLSKLLFFFWIHIFARVLKKHPFYFL